MIRKLNENEFDIIYGILDSSFPIDEYRPYEEQKALLCDERYTIYVLPSKDGDGIKAFISVWCFMEFAYVEHFAVAPEYRNQGVGASILKELQEIINCPICLEVELPDTEIAVKRIEFYKRNGFYLNEYPYVQPSISKGRKEIPLFIMTTDKEVSESEFETIRDVLFNEVYKKKK